MITKIAKIKMTAQDEQELKQLAGAVQDVMNLPQEAENGIQTQDVIYLLQFAKKNPQLMINALSFID